MKVGVIMNKQTDLQNIKRIAKGLLNISVLETEYSPMIVSHPFTKCGIVTLLENDDFFQLDITKSQTAFDKWKAQISQQIDESQNVYHVYYLLNDSYRLMFFDSVANFLSKEDYATLLGESWVSSEYANLDSNVTKKQMLEHFKKADKQALMSESELETYEDLNDTITIYRGVSSKQKKHVDALSWTTSFGKAKWFAERWDKGVVYAATINKEDVFAYFDRKNEDEVVVDYGKLQNIKITNKPLPPIQKGQPSME